MPLGAGAVLAVGRAHPNPFGRETRFSVTLQPETSSVPASNTSQEPAE